MKMIETTITVRPDGSIQIPPHPELVAGEHRPVLVVEELPTAAPNNERERVRAVLRAAGKLAELTPGEVVEQAVRRTQQHRLRGYDAVQLALALDAHVTTAAAGLPVLTFVAAADDLLASTRAEGRAAANPNQHP